MPRRPPRHVLPPSSIHRETALAISRHLQDLTGVTIKKLVQTLRPLRTVTIDISGQTITADPTITPEAHAILDALSPSTG